MPRPVPLIGGVLYSDMEHVVFGPQGTAKTFLLIDWALHLAFGRRWMGRATQHARTLIVCGEGGGRLMADRFDAWLEHYGIDNDEAARQSVRVTEFPVAMLDGDSVDELLALIHADGDEFGLIAIDTLAANLGPGDENDGADMSAFCAAMRRVRLATKAGVIVVHHTGHADRTRPQGSNQLRRNPDIELRVDRCLKDERLFGVMGGGELKSRHGAGCGLIPYRLQSVPIGQTDAAGEPVSSCVVVPTQDVPLFDGAKEQKLGLGKNQRTAIRVLNEIAERTGQDVGHPEGVFVTTADFRKAMADAGIRKQAVTKVRSAFRDRGWIFESVGGFRWIPSEK